MATPFRLCIKLVISKKDSFSYTFYSLPVFTKVQICALIYYRNFKLVSMNSEIVFIRFETLLNFPKKEKEENR